jgi:large subunit ribosomal protein L29
MPTASELRELDDEELENRLSEYRREMLNLRFQLATGQLDNVVRLSVLRKDVARVLTVLRDREIALAEGRDAGPVVSSRPTRRRPAEDVETDEVVDEDVVDEDVVEEPVARRRRAPRAQAAEEAPDTVDEEHRPESGGDADEEEK